MENKSCGNCRKINCPKETGDASKFKIAPEVISCSDWQPIPTPNKRIEVSKIIADFRSIVITKTIEAMGKNKDFKHCNAAVEWGEDKIISAIQTYLAQEIERQGYVKRVDVKLYSCSECKKELSDKEIKTNADMENDTKTKRINYCRECWSAYLHHCETGE